MKNKSWSWAFLALSLSLSACGKSGGADAAASAGATTPQTPSTAPSAVVPPATSFALGGAYTKASAYYVVPGSRGGYLATATLPGGCAGILVPMEFSLSSDGTTAEINSDPATVQNMSFGDGGSVGWFSPVMTFNIVEGSIPANTVAYGPGEYFYQIPPSDVLVHFSSSCVVLYDRTGN